MYVPTAIDWNFSFDVHRRRRFEDKTETYKPQLCSLPVQRADTCRDDDLHIFVYCPSVMGLDKS